MEHQARLSLEDRIQQWRSRYETQDAFSRDQLHELEAHLRDSVSTLHSTGLAENEAFLIAAHRLGEPAPLAQQFQTNAGAAWWMKRLTWMLGGVVVFNGLEQLRGIVSYLLVWFWKVRPTEMMPSLFLTQVAVSLLLIFFFWLLLRRQGLVARWTLQKCPGWLWMTLLAIAILLKPVVIGIGLMETIHHPQSILWWTWGAQAVAALWPMGWMILFVVVWKRSRTMTAGAQRAEELR